MLYLLISLIGSSILGISFLKIELGSISIFGLVVVAAACEYAVSLVRIGRSEISLCFVKSERWLLAFFIVGVVSLILSVCGVYKTVMPLDVLYDDNYILRQAYYLYFIPAVFLVARSSFSHELIAFLQRHYVACFILTYLSCLIVGQSFSLRMTGILFLGTILLLGRERSRVIDCALLVLLLITPLGVGGEQTQVVLKLLLIILFTSSNPSKVFRSCLYLMVMVILLCLVIANMPLGKLGLDGNTVWRAMYWQSQIQQVVATAGLGVGYGSSYATVSFASGGFTGIPFNPDSEYSRMEKIFLVGSHNSYVSILYRLGIVGFVLFLSYHLQIAAESRMTVRAGDNYACYAFLGSMVILAFNVGLESPMNLLTFVFSSALMGMISQREKVEGLEKSFARDKLINPVRQKSAGIVLCEVNTYSRISVRHSALCLESFASQFPDQKNLITASVMESQHES